MFRRAYLAAEPTPYARSLYERILAHPQLARLWEEQVVAEDVFEGSSGPFERHHPIAGTFSIFTSNLIVSRRQGTVLRIIAPADPASVERFAQPGEARLAVRTRTVCSNGITLRPRKAICYLDMRSATGTYALDPVVAGFFRAQNLRLIHRGARAIGKLGRECALRGSFEGHVLHARVARTRALGMDRPALRYRVRFVRGNLRRRQRPRFIAADRRLLRPAAPKRRS